MKKFNKLLNKSKKADDDTAPPSRPAPTSDATNDARAQYYASRQAAVASPPPPASGATLRLASSAGGGNPFDSPVRTLRTKTSNPFGDDDDDDEEEDADEPKSKTKNPFVGDSSDDDDDPLAGFSKKKSPPAPPPPKTMTSSAPVSVGAVSPRPAAALSETPRPATAFRASTTGSPMAMHSSLGVNPFDDSPKTTRVADRLLPNTNVAQIKTNPFDTDSVAPPTSTTEKKNPFDDDHDHDRKNAGKQTNIGGRTNPFDDESVLDKKHNTPANPSASLRTVPAKTNPMESSPQKLKPSSTEVNLRGKVQPANHNVRGSNNNNPLEYNAKTATALSRPPMPRRSISHNEIDNLPPLEPPPIVAAAHGAAAGAGTTTDKRKRWSGFGNRMADTDSTRPILAGMDEESLATQQQQQQQQLLLNQRAGPASNAAGLASWLRLNKKDDDQDVTHHHAGGAPFSSVPHTLKVKKKAQHTSNTQQQQQQQPHQRRQQHQQQQQQPQRQTRKKCKAVITPWPFDNFHEIQEKMLYEELASRAASDYNTHISAGDNERGYHSGSDDDEKKDDIHHSAMGSSEAKYYERPEELPSIKEAVNHLPLVDFEKKAEERAINIISTWLFDAGLIDELLVTGAMASPPLPLASSSDRTVQSSEGVEIGQHGFPLLGSAEGAEQKIDRETNKLRGMIQRDLSIINARLNDGVAASGLEVQELVNAVSATKEDIGRLRELTTYISDGQISDRDEFLLAKYPHLRKAINARRNINRCFRELEFFSQIPSTCDRLRDELHGGEWTEEEWSTIRNVAMEHVELEIMLVEAEQSMKAGRNFNDAMVDNFLDSHVKNVWELGDEIRMRMLSGIGSAFELAINNPAGMVALVEAVEVYEKAAESFEKKRQESGVVDSGKLRFTNMRAAALEQLYQDFELRGVEMFRGIHEQAADIAEEEDAHNTQFTAVLKAATELVTEIDIVKHQMSPCFAPHWHVEALWSSCVAHVCSNHIVQQIGGPDGQNLPELTITQLLELVAWVEYFRETIEETFPEVAEMRDTKKTYFEERPDLFAGDKRTVNMRNATDSLAWVNNMLWEVHRLAQEEFLVRTRSQTDEWLDKVYGSETVKNQSSEGKLTTSLCEDVFSFSSVQLRTIRERLSKKSDALILAVCIILSHMRSKQVHSRNNFLQDLETCCAASNDFTRMSEKCEDLMTDLLSECEFSEDMIATLEASSNELMAVYSSDAVYAARSVHIYVFDPIEEEIGTRLFEQAWEEDMVGNDLALSLIRTLEDFHDDLVHFMDDFMVVKSVMSLMSATVIFYVKCLLMRAEKHRNNKKPYFGDVQTALNRMTGDIKVMRDYFEGLVPKMPALQKNIEKDFEILSTIHELMSIAAQLSISEAEDFILVLQKRVRDVGITKHIVGDLWHLVAPTNERYVWELVESMEEQLVAIAPVDDALALEVNDRSYVKGLRLDEMAVKLYVKSRRNRPIQSTAAEKIVNNWRTTWAVRE